MKRILFLMLVTMLFIVGCQENTNATAITVEKMPRKVEKAIRYDLTLQSVSTANEKYIIYRSTKDVIMTYKENIHNRKLYLTETESDSDELKTYIYKMPEVTSDNTFLTVYVNDEEIPFDMATGVGGFPF